MASDLVLSSFSSVNFSYSKTTQESKFRFLLVFTLSGQCVRMNER